MDSMTVTPEIRDRIMAAANELYEENGRNRFPTVDSVRRAAKSSMNDASAVMREWRRSQTAQPEVVSITVPEPVAEAFHTALLTAWQAAMSKANESLQEARQLWDLERQGYDELRAEISSAFEELEASLKESNMQNAALMARVAVLEEELTVQKGTVSERNVRISELESKLQERSERVDELKGELTTEREMQAETSRAHKAELEELNLEHRGDLEAFQEKHLRELRAGEKEAQASLDLLRKEHAAAQLELKKEIDEYRDRVTKDAAKQAQMKSELERQVAVAQERQVEIERLKGEVDGSRRDNRKLDTVNRELNARLDAAAREVTKTEARANRLEEKLVELARGKKSSGDKRD